MFTGPGGPTQGRRLQRVQYVECAGIPCGIKILQGVADPHRLKTLWNYRPFLPRFCPYLSDDFVAALLLLRIIVSNNKPRLMAPFYDVGICAPSLVNGRPVATGRKTFSWVRISPSS